MLVSHKESQKNLFLLGHEVFTRNFSKAGKAIACMEFCNFPVKAVTLKGHKIKHCHLNFWREMPDYGPPVEIFEGHKDSSFEEYLDMLLENVYRYVGKHSKVYLKIYYEGVKIVKSEIDIE